MNSRRKLPVTAVILAGGRATRMGGTDKGLVELCGRPMIEHVLAALEPQVEHMVINANRNLERYAAFGRPVVTDADGAFLGPLAGLSAGLGAATTDLVLTVPCDCPLLVPDLAHRLHAAMQQQDAEIAVPFDGERLQPVFALVQRKLADSLAAYLAAGDRKIDLWFARHRLARVDFSDCPENFVNVNDPAERSALEARLMAGDPGA
ncbi:molybdenum cofactor guanylyltransferase MobA [Wenzhouxiangella sp. XN24]|uniref:molybdenum cofactor guanylyltransferase MobA n=1 Tax=Wenzhouxiangella sp. XN24 TaxID=2713569 RepID=UPI0013EDBAD3|nr:molybdenum cofactor guanylyltransferase MobA [Wenzhouxiangella sp. XN24]NGX14944.1 molybdenum cofactor guanylyltransferase [Wenzhouxiangella sp. XN24]